MGPLPWWKRIFYFIRELICRHTWEPMSGSFTGWRFCPKCEKTDMGVPTFGPSVLRAAYRPWRLLQILNRETKHETRDREDQGGPEGHR